MIKIDKNIPIPSKEGRPNKYPFEVMDVGDSFELKNTTKTTVLNAANSWAKRHNKKVKFAIRYDKQKRTLRIWRTE